MFYRKSPLGPLEVPSFFDIVLMKILKNISDFHELGINYRNLVSLSLIFEANIII